MMHGRGKSDFAIVAGKSANKAERLAAEPTERRAGAKGNVDQQITCRAQNRESVSQALERIRQAATQRKKERFTSLLHHINVDLLRLAFFELKRSAAPGVDGLTWQDYEADLELRLVVLHAPVQRGAYRALPSRRRYIPKADGRQRPLAVAALEDKIVQRAVVAVLNAIMRKISSGSVRVPTKARTARCARCSCCRDHHQKGEHSDADIRSCFDSVNQAWLIRFVQHRIKDLRIIRLIQKWLKAGILEDGIVTISETGTGQGSVASPLLANVYLHYVFDLWDSPATA